MEKHTMLNFDNGSGSEIPTDMDLMTAFDLGIGPFKRELEKLTDQQYVKLLTLLDKYSSPL